MYFGLHEVLDRPARYFTLLREPRDRVVSLFYYALRESRTPQHAQAVDECWSLADFVRSGVAVVADNGMVRVLSGEDPPYGEVGETHLRLADNNLKRHFDLVGLVEYFDESLLLLAQRYGWRYIHYVLSNRTPGRPLVESIEPADLRVVEEYNRFDIELYQRWRDHFIAELEAQPPAFRRRLCYFRAINRLYALGHPYTQRLLYWLYARRYQTDAER